MRILQKDYIELRDAFVLWILLLISIGQKLVLVHDGGLGLFHTHEKYRTVPLRLANRLWL